jgi:threonine-phosphate decarboxylase
MLDCVHGGDVREASREFGIAPEDLLDFSANINPLGFPEEVRQSVSAHLEKISQYPDPLCTEFRDALSARHGLDVRRILVGNGSCALIHRIVEAIRPARALICAPAFGEYAGAARRFGVGIKLLLSCETDGFALKLDRIEEMLDGIAVVFLCNPNNPTGQAMAQTVVLRLAEQCRRRGITLVVDEAFVEFADDPERFSVLEAIRDFENLLILRSFTKLYGCPGLRLGYALGALGVIKKIARCQEPWAVSTLAQAAGIAVLPCEAFREQTQRLIHSERAFLFQRLDRIAGIRPFPSEVNFFLIKIGRRDLNAGTLRRRLGKKGILIRDASSFDGLDNRFFRIAVRTHEENERLLRVLEEALHPSVERKP